MDWTTISEIGGGSAVGVAGVIAFYWKKLTPFFKNFLKDKTKLAEMKIEARKEVEIAKAESGSNEGVIQLLTERIDKLEKREDELQERIIILEKKLSQIREKYAEKTVLKSGKRKDKKNGKG